MKENLANFSNNRIKTFSGTFEINLRISILTAQLWMQNAEVGKRRQNYSNYHKEKGQTNLGQVSESGTFSTNVGKCHNHAQCLRNAKNKLLRFSW